MTFRDLIEQMAKRIGQHQLPVNAAATDSHASCSSVRPDSLENSV